MIQTVIVEDDSAEQEKLKAFLDRYAQENDTKYETVVYSDAETFLKSYRRADIVFMDIELPGKNGLEASRKIREFDGKVAIVFVTNMAQFAINGYEVDALDFVVKPLEYDDFVLKMKRVMRFVETRKGKKIYITQNSGVFCIEDAEVFYLEVMKHNVTYHTAQGDYTIRGTMKAAETQLSRVFARCGNSYLVNLRFVKEVKRTAVCLRGVRDDGTILDAELPITRGFRVEFMKAFSAYVGGLL